MKYNVIADQVEPLTIRWEDWRRFASAVPSPTGHTALTILDAVKRWQAEVRIWVSGLRMEQRRDLMDLLIAEFEMLEHGAYDYSAIREDFRERYYEALALLTVMEQLVAPRTDLAQLVAEAARVAGERRFWLP